MDSMIMKSLNNCRKVLHNKGKIKTLKYDFIEYLQLYILLEEQFPVEFSKFKKENIGLLKSKLLSLNLPYENMEQVNTLIESLTNEKPIINNLKSIREIDIINKLFSMDEIKNKDSGLEIIKTLQKNDYFKQKLKV